MNCQQIQAYLKTNLGKKVPREMGKVIKEHLKDCSQCQKSYQQLYKSYMAKKQQIPKGSYEPSEESAFLPITFPGMKIVKKLGQGAMGKVYQAFQLSLKRHVALKVLSKDLAKNEKFVKRFLREARALAKLKHPNIVAIYDVGFSQGLFYYIMEFVDGRSLKEILHEKEVLEPKEALNIVKEVAKALVEAEAHDIVHRDIKPGNILIDQNGQIKLADLGLAKTRWKDQKVSEETAVGTLIGTPHYMAPEQIRNSREVTIQADIYSLGVTFYQMVTGHLPYTGNTNFEVLSNILQEEVEFDEKEEERIPLGYRQIMLKMMAKDPKERYKSPKELLEDIKLMKESGSQTLVASSFLQLDKESKSLIFWSITVGALGMLVVSLLAFMIFGFPSQKKKTSNTTTSPSSQNHSHQSQTTHSHSSGTTTGSGSPLPHPPKSTFQEPKPFSFTYDLYLAIANHKIKNNEWIRLLQPALIVKKEVFISNKKLQTIIYITNSRVSVDDLAVYFPFYLQELEVGDGVILHKGKLHYYGGTRLHPEYETENRHLHFWEITYKNFRSQKVLHHWVEKIPHTRFKSFNFRPFEEADPKIQSLQDLQHSRYENSLFQSLGSIRKIHKDYYFQDSRRKYFYVGYFQNKTKLKGTIPFLIENFMARSLYVLKRTYLLQRNRNRKLQYWGIWKQMDKRYDRYLKVLQQKSYTREYAKQFRNHWVLLIRRLEEKE